MKQKVRGGRSYSRMPWYGVKRVADFRVVGDEGTNVIERVAHGLKDVLELCGGFRLGLRKGHLDAAVSVDFAFSRSLDRQEADLGITLYKRCLYAIGLQRRQTPEWLESQDEVAGFLTREIKSLAYLEMSLSSAQEVL
jgi:hypothetical protein